MPPAPICIRPRALLQADRGWGLGAAGRVAPRILDSGGANAKCGGRVLLARAAGWVVRDDGAGGGLMEMKRLFNFSAGPATLPPEVLEASARALVDYNGMGAGIAELSHRGAE